MWRVRAAVAARLWSPCRSTLGHDNHTYGDAMTVNTISAAPIDVMVGRCRGPIIAVDVFPYRRAEGTNGNSVSHRRGFFRRLKPLAEGMPPSSTS